MSDSEYRRVWSNYTSTGPVAWRAPHHREPDHEYAMLCDDAERRRLVVRLGVTTGKKPLGAPGHEYRNLTRLTVGPIVGAPVVTVWLRPDERLSVAAATARRELELA